MSLIYDTAAQFRSERLAAAEHYRLIRSVQRPTRPSLRRRLGPGPRTLGPRSHRPPQSPAPVAA